MRKDSFCEHAETASLLTLTRVVASLTHHATMLTRILFQTDSSKFLTRCGNIVGIMALSSLWKIIDPMKMSQFIT